MADLPTPPRGPLGANQPPPPVGPLARTTPDQPAPPIGPLAAAHPTHDLLLVAAWASDDLDGAAHMAATELIDGCSACAALASDLRALAVATRSLPPARRPRDFALSPADAERLRPHGLRRLLAALATPRSVSRPLAASLTTLGVAGLLLASLPGILPFGAAGAPGAARENDNEQVAPLDGDIGAPAASGAPGLSFGDDRDTAGGEADPTQSGDHGSGPPAIETAAGESGPSVLVVLSGSFLIVGLGLFALRWTGRRLGSG